MNNNKCIDYNLQYKLFEFTENNWPKEDLSIFDKFY